MNTEIFLLNDSFPYPASGIGITDLEDRIQALADDYTFIREHGDRLLKHDSIYNVVIYPNLTVSECLYNSQTKNFKRRPSLLFQPDYFNRIYFHEGKENVAQGRILIGHIGGHLQF